MQRRLSYRAKWAKSYKPIDYLCVEFRLIAPGVILDNYGNLPTNSMRNAKAMVASSRSKRMLKFFTSAQEKKRSAQLQHGQILWAVRHTDFTNKSNVAGKKQTSGGALDIWVNETVQSASQLQTLEQQMNVQMSRSVCFLLSLQILCPCFTHSLSLCLQAS